MMDWIEPEAIRLFSPKFPRGLIPGEPVDGLGRLAKL